MIAARTQSNAGGANSALARRLWQAADREEYLVPGEQVLCLVSLAAEHPSAGGCAPAASLEAKGTTSLTVIPGGFELTGILPRGVHDVQITDASARSVSIAADADRAFLFLSAVPLARLEYDLPGGARCVASLALPAAPQGGPVFSG
jgi:hypothetical protein